jgi:hypothetical protein
MNPVLKEHYDAMANRRHAPKKERQLYAKMRNEVGEKIVRLEKLERVKGGW